MADQSSTSTALVRRIEWVAISLMFNPQWCHDVSQPIDCTDEGMDAEQLRDWIDKLIPGRPHRYRLPKHLHWMGEPS